MITHCHLRPHYRRAGRTGQLRRDIASTRVVGTRPFVTPGKKVPGRIFRLENSDVRYSDDFVRFTPNSGHFRHSRQCPLIANNSRSAKANITPVIRLSRLRFGTLRCCCGGAVPGIRRGHSSVHRTIRFYLPRRSKIWANDEIE